MVVDIGGGTGVSAVRIAGMGHRVTVVDPSPDALASLGRRAREEGVEVVAHQGDLSSLLAPAGPVAPGSADLVLCHGVLEHVTDAAGALATLHEVLRPGGALSLLVAQRSTPPVCAPRPSTASASSPTWSPARCSTSSPVPPQPCWSWSRPSPSARSTSPWPPSSTCSPAPDSPDCREVTHARPRGRSRTLGTSLTHGRWRP
jgi:hypothetical protein